jgi:lactate dehydrogenase-like 2-hydroxyacid dehydrogenase
MQLFPNLAVISRYGVGYDNIDTVAASEKGGYFKDSTK